MGLDRKELERAIEMVARSRLAKTVHRPNDRPMRNKTYLDCEVERIKRQLSEFRPILRVFRGALRP